MVNISFPCQVTTKLRKGTLEEGSRTANQTVLKCAVSAPDWNPFIFRQWEGLVVYQEVSAIDLRTQSCRVLHTLTVTSNSLLLSQIFLNWVPGDFFYYIIKDNKFLNSKPFKFVPMSYVCQPL